MDENLTELRAIRELLEWQKGYMEWSRAYILARAEEAEQRTRKLIDEILEKAATGALETYRQAEAEARHEHEVRCHGKADVKPRLVS